jgi:rubredoxin
VLFAATSVALGTVGTPLEHSGKLEVCQLVGFEEGLGSEETGALPGIAYNDTYNDTQCRLCDVPPFDTAIGRSEDQLQVTLAGGRTR